MSRADGIRVRFRIWTIRVYLGLAALALWSAITGFFRGGSLVSHLTPWAVARSALQVIMAPSFVVDLLATLGEWGIAILVSLVLGITAGLLLGSNRVSSGVAEPLVYSMYGFPKTLLLPFFLMFLGAGLVEKSGFAVFSAMFWVAGPVFSGMRSLDRQHLQMATSFGHRLLSRWTKVVIPELMPSLLLGARFGIIISLVGVLNAELFVSQRGLGFLLLESLTQQANMSEVVGLSVILTLLPLLAYGLFGLLSRVILARSGIAEADLMS